MGRVVVLHVVAETCEGSILLLKNIVALDENQA
jgi:hypothetical protein